MLDRVIAFPAAVATGAALGAYSFVEPYLFRLRTVLVPLRPGAPALDVLHLSDLHMRSSSKRLQRFLENLPDRLTSPPDFVLATGDLIEDDGGIPAAVAGLDGLPARFGKYYVLGSHDYYQSEFQAYTKYWTGKRPVKAPPADTATLRSGLEDTGWKPLMNETEIVDTPGARVRLTGLDDPYLKRHKTGHIERGGDDVAIGLQHSPDVVSEFVLAGFDLIVAGHTHAGQVRPPFVGTIVTNCSLPRQIAGGFSKVGDSWLHVSPGLGSGRFAPIRFNCRPEATLMMLRPSRDLR